MTIAIASKSRGVPDLFIITVLLLGLLSMAPARADRLLPPPIPKTGAVTTITNVVLKRGACSEQTDVTTSESYVFMSEEFSVIVHLNIPFNFMANETVRIAYGVDSRGAHSATRTISAHIGGVLRVCIDGLQADWPGRLLLRTEVYQSNDPYAEIRSPRELEFDVVSRGRVDPVFFAQFNHATVRTGVPRYFRLLWSKFLILPITMYVANGTPYTRTVGPRISTRIYASGSNYVDVTSYLDAPLEVAPYSVSAETTFSIVFDSRSDVAQAIMNDKAPMIAFADGQYNTPGQRFVILDWATMLGLPVDVVFVGDFTAEERARAYDAVVENGNGYLQTAGIKLHADSSRQFLATQIGMSADVIEQLRQIDDWSEWELLASYQPPKSQPRMTIYIVEEIAGAMGVVGAYSTQPNTPFRSPILALNSFNLSVEGSTQGVQFLGAVAAHELGHAYGLTHTDADTCADTDAGSPSDAFNVMFKWNRAYSWVLSPCQQSIVRTHPEFYRN